MGQSASKDTQQYREGYPGLQDDPSEKSNAEFYLNLRASEPSGDTIENIHKQWWGNYELLERHHGYIQWLFPIREQGLNHRAHRLHLHEIATIKADPVALARLITSYKMMLDFYGMVLLDESTGAIGRKDDNYRARYAHLNSSYHNYLRITRILKSLGEFGFEHYKAPFVRHVMTEIFVHKNLIRARDSCINYWAPVIRDDAARDALEGELAAFVKSQPVARYDPYARYRAAAAAYAASHPSDDDSDDDDENGNGGQAELEDDSYEWSSTEGIDDEAPAELLDALTARISAKLEARLSMSHAPSPSRVDAAASGDRVARLAATSVIEQLSAACVVCMEVYSMTTEALRPVLLVPCGHTPFCHGCFLAFSKRSAQHVCPLCRAPISSQTPNVVLGQMMDALKTAEPATVTSSASLAGDSAANSLPDPASCAAEEAHLAALLEPTGASVGRHDLALAARYLKDLRSNSLRLDVLAAEASQAHADHRHFVAKASAGELVAHHLADERGALSARIDALLAERAALDAQIASHSSKLTAIAREAQLAADEAALLDETIAGVKRQTAKARLLLDGLLPPGIAAAATSGDYILQ
ncbi:uncharacterized protein AMSG_11938 [Thecamonas trahens ATCC 50062]|uniref:RING-type domain-containing protein n=1 Tax=Thecamonas trahens ATCC 50062 TaxID=461836 RepID=A0A0L0DBV6_THETB|nr:hypothetical protein AMSG_11938 [Thecamonas trahens ATCC 50062]KNC49834.1 hypothetical protein AMSG_11938 [Thecamonas trahens ATCC 50062]|eukprot:XP_013757438.1 hypothetical protein AMSG_11938 [Thecamonas trahens ATCC 50062]